MNEENKKEIEMNEKLGSKIRDLGRNIRAPRDEYAFVFGKIEERKPIPSPFFWRTFATLSIPVALLLLILSRGHEETIRLSNLQMEEGKTESVTLDSGAESTDMAMGAGAPASLKMAAPADDDSGGLLMKSMNSEFEVYEEAGDENALSESDSESFMDYQNVYE